MKNIHHSLQFPLLLFLSTLLILFLNYYPNFYAKNNAPEGMVFSGQAALLDPWDINVYVSAINWSQENRLYFQNAYTTIAHKPTLIYPFYTLMSIFFPKANPFALYQALTIVTAIAFTFFIYKLARRFIDNKYYALLATNLALLGGGLGWYFYENIPLSSDLTLTPLTFASTLTKPHEMLALIFYFTSLYFTYIAVTKVSSKHSLISTIFLGLSILFYPYFLLTYALVSLIYFTIRHRFKAEYFFKTLFTPFAINTLLVLIYGNYLLSDMSYFGVTKAVLTKPDIYTFIGGYGLLGFISLAQIFKKKKSKKAAFANIWFFSGIAASFLPISYSKYFLRGLFLPLSIIVVSFIKPLSEKFNLDKLSVALALLLISSLSSIYLFNLNMVSAKNRNSRFIYLKKEEFRTFEFLDKFTKKGTGVLSTYVPGNYIPAYTHNRVYYGHDTQTPRSREKVTVLNKFYSIQMNEQEARKFLEENKIKYIYWGQDEKKLTESSGNEFLDYPFLDPVYQNSEVVIYETEFYNLTSEY